MEDFDNFEELDPIDELRLQEEIDRQLANDCRYIYSVIEEFGYDKWYKSYRYGGSTQSDVSSKIIVTNQMIKYFESVEEYEKCAHLLNSMRKAQLDELVEETKTEVPGSFFDWSDMN